MSSQHVTVVLTGDGGDESFGGYQRYLMAMTRRIPVPMPARPGLRRLGSSVAAAGRQRSKMRRVGRVLEALGEPLPRRYARSVSHSAPEQKIQLYTDELREQLAAVDSYLLIDRAYAASRAHSCVGKIMEVDINTYLPGDLLVKVDITTMACSLEARAPFLDHQLMEWAAGLPGQLKIRRGATKFLLKQAMAPWLPPELLDRRKQGFGVPLATWLRVDFRELARDVLTDATAQIRRGLFRPEAIASMLREHDQGRDHASRLWAHLAISTDLYRLFVDTPSSLAPSSRCPVAFCEMTMRERREEQRGHLRLTGSTGRRRRRCGYLSR